MFNQFGQGTQHVLIGWLVLSMTDSASLLGVAFAVRSAPNLAVGLAAGPITDRFDRRALMRFAVWGMMLVSLALALLLFFDLLTLVPLMVGIFLLGALQAFYMTARQAYVYDVVGSGGAVSGLALIGLAQRSGQLIGALLAGVAILWLGPAASFLGMGIGYSFGGGCIYFLRQAGQAAPGQREPMVENLLNYARALRSNKILLSLMISTAAAEVLGFSHQVILPVLALEVLKVGAGGLGVLNAFRSVGASIGVAGLAMLGNVKRPGILLLATLFLFGVSQILLGQSVTLWMALLFVALVNVMAAVSDVLHQGLLQVSVSNEQRGRAMGSWIVGIGTAPLGQLELGALADLTSSRIALLVNGTGLAALAIVMAVILPRLRKLGSAQQRTG